MHARARTRTVIVQPRPLQELMVDSGDAFVHREMCQAAIVYHVADPWLCGFIRNAILEIDARREERRRELPRRDYDMWRGEQMRKAVIARCTWRHQDDKSMTPTHRIETHYHPCVRGTPATVEFVNGTVSHDERVPSRALPVRQPISIDESHLKTMWNGSVMFGVAPKTRGVFSMLVFGTFCGLKLIAMVDRAWKVHLIRAAAPSALFEGTVLLGEIVRLRTGRRDQAAFIAFDAELVCGVSVSEYVHLVRLQAASIALEAWSNLLSSAVGGGSTPSTTGAAATAVAAAAAAVEPPIYVFTGTTTTISSTSTSTTESDPSVSATTTTSMRGTDTNDSLPWTGYHPVSPIAGDLTPPYRPLSPPYRPLSPILFSEHNPTSPPQPPAPPPVQSANHHRPMSPLLLDMQKHREVDMLTGSACDDVCGVEWPFRLRVKQFYRTGDVPSLIADVLPLLDHDVDGLVLVEIDGRLWFKLKLDHSIDFYVDVLNARTFRLLALDDRHNWVQWVRVQIDDDEDFLGVQPAGYIHCLADLHGRVVECTYERQRWMPTIVRLGKRTPNSLRTALATWHNLLQNLTLCKLFPPEIVPGRRDVLEAFDKQPVRTWQPLRTDAAAIVPPPVALYPRPGHQLLEIHQRSVS